MHIQTPYDVRDGKGGCMRGERKSEMHDASWHAQALLLEFLHQTVAHDW